MKQKQIKTKKNTSDDSDDKLTTRRIIRLDEMRIFLKYLQSLDLEKLSAEKIESILCKIIKMLNSRYSKYLTKEEKDSLNEKKKQLEYQKTIAIGFEL